MSVANVSRCASIELDPWLTNPVLLTTGFLVRVPQKELPNSVELMRAQWLTDAVPDDHFVRFALVAYGASFMACL